MTTLPKDISQELISVGSPNVVFRLFRSVTPRGTTEIRIMLADESRNKLLLKHPALLGRVKDAIRNVFTKNFPEVGRAYEQFSVVVNANTPIIRITPCRPRPPRLPD